MKKKDIVTRLINLQFEVAQHAADYDYIIKNQDQILENSGVPWYQHYTITSKQEETLKKLAIPIIKKELKIRTKVAEREYGWFNLQYGLKTRDNDST